MPYTHILFALALVFSGCGVAPVELADHAECSRLCGGLPGTVEGGMIVDRWATLCHCQPAEGEALGQSFRLR